MSLNGLAQDSFTKGIQNPETRQGPEALLPDVNVDPGNVVVIPIQVNDLEDLDQLMIRISFDEIILTNTSSYGTGGVLDNGDYDIQVMYFDPNIIQFTFNATSPNLFSGSGEVGYLRFTAGNFGTSPLDFQMFSVNGTSYMSNTTNGMVVVTDCYNASAYAGSNATICEGQTFELADATASNFETLLWETQGDGFFDDPTILHPVYTPGTQDINDGYTFLCLRAFALPPCLDAFNCVKLSFLEMPEVTCPEYDLVCEDLEPFELTGATPEGGEYSGTGVVDGIFDPSTGPGTYDITYFYIDEFGCSNSCLFQIQVTPLPTVFAGEDGSICQDFSGYQLSGEVENASSFFWYTLIGSGTFDNEFALDAIYTPSTVDYMLGSVDLCLKATGILPCGVDSTDCMTLSFSPLPEVTCPDDMSTCDNEESFLLSGGLPEGGEYTGLAVVDNVFYPDLAEIGQNEISYTYTNEQGCPGSCTFNIDVAPSATVNAGGDATICELEVFENITASASNYSSVQWMTLNGGGVFDNENIVNATYYPSPSVDYPQGSIFLIFVAAPISPCTVGAQDQLTLSFQMLPDVDAGEDVSICAGGSIITDASVENSTGNYFWTTSGDGSFGDPTLLSTEYIPGDIDITSGSVILSLSAEPISPCATEITGDLVLTIISPPSANAGEDASICANDEPFLMAGSAQNASSVLWVTVNGTGSFDDPTSLDASYIPTEIDYLMGTIQICLQVSAIDPCTGTDVDCMALTFYPLPDVTLEAYEPLCAGDDEFELYGGLPEGGTYFVDGNEATSFDPVVAGEYVLAYFYTDENGCTNSAEGQIVVNPVPVFDCPEYGPYCEGGATVIFEGVGVYTYEGDVVTEFDPEVAGTYSFTYTVTEFIPEVAGTYSFTYTETTGFGCSTSCGFDIVVNPVPVFDCPEYGPYCEGDATVCQPRPRI
ncbi:MAG: hypothetical protein B6D61_12160 [Bacteroidetes bacterium 4484_249]|nr:MAG: hypothetical protein B6D61_12160 [Bacteroidetes bacterium 4484_249]